MSATYDPGWSTTSTSSTYYYEEPKIHLKRAEQEFCPEPLQNIIKAGVLKGNIVIFGHSNSLVFKSKYALYDNGATEVYYTDPFGIGRGKPPNLLYYDRALIIDALEYLPEMMSRANLIKEALDTLKNGSGGRSVIMITKTPEMVNSLAKENKYEEADNGFLLPTDHKFGGLTIRGIDSEELMLTSYFAGALLAEIDNNIKTDMACIRAYPNRERQ